MGEQDVARKRKRGGHLRVIRSRRISAGGTAGVDEELAVALKGLETVGMAGEQDVDFHLPGREVERLGVAPRDHLVAVQHTHPHTPVRHHFTLRKARILCNRRHELTMPLFLS